MVASVEAFVNEVFLGSMAQSFMRGSPLWSLSEDWLEKVELREKLILVPQLLFGQSLLRGEQPYQHLKVS